MNNSDEEKPPLVKQPSAMPTRKVGRGNIVNGGISTVGLTTFIMLFINRYYDGNPPNDVMEFLPYFVAFISWAATSAAGYMTHNRRPPLHLEEVTDE